MNPPTTLGPSRQGTRRIAPTAFRRMSASADTPMHQAMGPPIRSARTAFFGPAAPPCAAMDDLDIMDDPAEARASVANGSFTARERDVTTPSAVISQPIDQLFRERSQETAGYPRTGSRLHPVWQCWKYSARMRQDSAQPQFVTAASAIEPLVGSRAIRPRPAASPIPRGHRRA
jgi:hypothetical protein